MSKKTKRAKRPVKRRTKNPSKSARSKKPATRSKPTSSRRPAPVRKSKKTAGQLISSARSLLEIDLGKAEGKQIAARTKPERKKHAKKAAEIRSQLRKLVKK